MKIITPRVFVPEPCQLGEGPFWFQERLWWIDINGACLHSVDGTGADPHRHDLGKMIGTVAPTTDGRFVIAREDGIGFFDPGTGEIEIKVSPEKDVEGNRFNDGKCDPAGRFLAGTLNMNGTPRHAALYSYSGGSQITTLLEDISISNGLAWSADGATLYYIDSPTKEVVRFVYDLESGHISDRQVVVTIPEGQGIPDGMDMDSQGNLWVAHWGGAAVRCWSPNTGKCLAEIPLPCENPTSCCFGGSKLSSLFITSAGPEFDTKKSSQDSLAGCVFVCDPGIDGGPVRSFKPHISE